MWNPLAISEAASISSFVAQMVSMGGAAVFSHFLSKTNASVWIWAFLGAFGAMCAHIAVDGQGAFLAMLYTPLIYWLAKLGRNDLP